MPVLFDADDRDAMASESVRLKDLGGPEAIELLTLVILGRMRMAK